MCLCVCVRVCVQLQHGTSDKLVYCHEALHLRKKLQTADYKEDVQKWDSDSDSDESQSEEEEDFSKYAK